MKRPLVLFVALVTAASCSKKENSDNGTSGAAAGVSPLNKFRFNDTTYAVTSAARQTNNTGDAVLVATGEIEGRTCTVRFIADSTRLVATTLRVGTHLLVTVDRGGASPLYAFGRTTISSQRVDAALTTENGKMVVTVPELWVYRASGLGPDSIRFSANAVHE